MVCKTGAATRAVRLCYFPPKNAPVAQWFRAGDF